MQTYMTTDPRRRGRDLIDCSHSRTDERLRPKDRRSTIVGRGEGSKSTRRSWPDRKEQSAFDLGLDLSESRGRLMSNVSVDPSRRRHTGLQDGHLEKTGHQRQASSYQTSNVGRLDSRTRGDGRTRGNDMPLSTISPNTIPMKRKYSEDKIETGTSTIHKASSTVATGANAISINTQRKPNLHQTSPGALPSQPSREVKGEGFRRISTLTKFQDRAWVEKFHQSLRRQRNITQDPWVRKGSIQPDSVVCNGCRQRVSLKNKERDVQGGYSNPGWVEHRERCYLLYLQWCKERNYDPKEIKKEKGG